MRTAEIVLAGDSLGRLADAVLVIAENGAIMDANAAAVRFYGYSIDQMLTLHIHDLRAPGYANLDEQFRSAIDSGAVYETVQVRRDGTEIPVSVHLLPALVDGRPVLLALLRDLTGREAAAQVLRTERGKLAAAVESADVGLVVCNARGGDVVMDATALDLYEFTSQGGYDRSVGLPSSAWELSYPEGRAIPPEDWPMARAIRGDFVREFDVHYRNPVTLTEWDCRLNIVPVRNGDGEVTVIVQTLRDVTQSRAAEKERQRAEALLKDLAMTDELTGLANRRSFTEVAERELRRAKRLGRPMAVAAIDVDHLKTINDTYGHAGGDQALVRLSETVTREIREIDVFARMGGDEFALLLTDASREQAYETVARIRGDLEDQPLTVDGEQVRVAISAGIASRDETVETLDQLLARADDALYEAKDAGRSRTELS